MKRPGQVHAGQTLSANDVNRLATEIHRLRGLTVEPPLMLTNVGYNPTLRLSDGVLDAVITGYSLTTPTAYAWSEVRPDGAGSWTVLPGGRSGTALTNPAFEVNDASVGVGTVVELMPGVGSEYVFEQCCPGDLLITSRSSDSTSRSSRSRSSSRSSTSRSSTSRSSTSRSSSSRSVARHPSACCPGDSLPDQVYYTLMGPTAPNPFDPCVGASYSGTATYSESSPGYGGYFVQIYLPGQFYFEGSFGCDETRGVSAGGAYSCQGVPLDQVVIKTFQSWQDPPTIVDIVSFVCDPFYMEVLINSGELTLVITE